MLLYSVGQIDYCISSICSPMLATVSILLGSFKIILHTKTDKDILHKRDTNTTIGNQPINTNQGSFTKKSQL